MKAIDYQVVKLYLQEVEKCLENELYLSCIAVCGIISELMVREFCGGSKLPLSKLLKKLHDDEKISEDLYTVLDTIREIRNKYIHLNLGKEIKSVFDGLAIIENGIVTFSSEFVRNAENPEEELIFFHRLNLIGSAERMFDLTKEALQTLQIGEAVSIGQDEKRITLFDYFQDKDF